MTGFKGTINTNGRPKGSKNKNTTEIREQFQQLVNSNLEQLNEDLQALKPLDRLKIIIDLAKFVVPTLKAVEINDVSDIENFQPIKIIFSKDE